MTPINDASDQIYRLPDLRYDYGALEPHISARIMELHHSKHHAAYVAGANRAIERLQEARTCSDYSQLSMLEKNLAFNLSGHVRTACSGSVSPPTAVANRPAGLPSRSTPTSAGSRRSRPT